MSLVFDPVGHVYTWNGKRVPNVTAIIRDALGDPFANVSPAVLEYARQRGQAVHKACELDDAGQLDERTVDPVIAGYLEAWRALRQAWRFRIMASELPIYNPALGYACTPDVVFEAPTTWGVIEIKTGLPGLQAELQTAAQLEAARHHFDMLQGGERFAVRLDKNGKPHFERHDHPGNWRDFLSCLNVCRLRERIAA